MTKSTAAAHGHIGGLIGGAIGGSANTAAQLAQRRAAAKNAGRPREPLACRKCSTPTTERDASRRPCHAVC